MSWLMVLLVVILVGCHPAEGAKLEECQVQLEVCRTRLEVCLKPTDPVWLGDMPLFEGLPE